METLLSRLPVVARLGWSGAWYRDGCSVSPFWAFDMACDFGLKILQTSGAVHTA